MPEQPRTPSLERVLKVMSTNKVYSLQRHSRVTRQTAQHDVNHRCINHGFTGFRQLFIVFAQSPITSQPGKCPFDYPATWKHDESDCFLGTLDYLENPACQSPDPIDHRLSTVTTIRPNQFQALEPLQGCSLKKQFGASPLLNTRFVDNNSQEQAQHIYHDMPFASLDFLVTVVPTLPLHFRGFGTLAINDRGTGFGFTTVFFAHGFSQGIVHHFPDTIFAPCSEVAIDCLPGRKVMRHHTPGATTPQNVENGVDDFSHTCPADTASSFRWWNEWFQYEPLDIGQISWIYFSVHTSNYARNEPNAQSLHNF
jgi:hypothetical protein